MKEKKSSAPISLSQFQGFLLDPIIPTRDVVDSNGEPIEKMLPFWRKKGLVPFLPKGKWAQISCADLIWLRILDTLRGFSFPVEKTQKVCDYFFKDAYNDDLPRKNLRHNKASLLQKKAAGTISAEEEHLLSMIETHLKDEKLLYMLKLEINYLTNLITDCIQSGEDRSILIFANGQVLESNGQEYFSHREVNNCADAPHIALSIANYIKEFVDDKELSELLMPRLLNEDETQVIKAMKIKNLKEVNIKMQGGRVLRIHSVRGGTITGDQAKEIKRILGLKNYESITLDTMDEKSLSFKKTNKKLT